MQRLTLAFLAVSTAFLCYGSPLRADDGSFYTVFNSQMVCEKNASPLKIAGSASIFKDGDLQIRLSGLNPNETYTCVIACGIGGLSSAAPCGPTNSYGKLNTFLPKLGLSSGSILSGCGEPVVSAFDPNGDNFCATGYGSP